MQSFIAFAIGMLRVIAAPSLPSASTHFAADRTPTSFRMVDSGTPVHSEVDVKPCVPCTVFSVGFDHSVKPLPEHSRNMMRDIDGKRRMSFIENFFACLTIPCTYSECLLGSMVAVPPWLRSKCSPDGVMIPQPFSSGVKVHEDSGVLVANRVRTSVSN